MHQSQLHFPTKECSQGVYLYLFFRVLFHVVDFSSAKVVPIAAMHYNENAQRKQAVTKRGEKQYSVLFPKYKKGGHTVRKVLKDCLYGVCTISSIPAYILFVNILHLV